MKLEIERKEGGSVKIRKGIIIIKLGDRNQKEIRYRSAYLNHAVIFLYTPSLK